jgi:hypothetical protein
MWSRRAKNNNRHLNPNNFADNRARCVAKITGHSGRYKNPFVARVLLREAKL